MNADDVGNTGNAAPRLQKGQTLNRAPSGGPATREHRVGRIIVIESLPVGELKTGTDLYETALAQRTPHNRDFAATRYEVATKSLFLGLLQQIARETEEHRLMPMLHIDAHGAMEGLELASGEFVPWGETKEGITAINVACRNHLIVVLAACMGIHLISIIRAHERTPAFAIISTAVEPSAHDMQISFRAFYEEMFRSRDGDAALRRLNGAFPSKIARYGIVHPETMFLNAFEHYTTTYLTPERVIERSERLERQARKSPVLDPRQQLERRQMFARELVDGLERRFNTDRDRLHDGPRSRESGALPGDIRSDHDAAGLSVEDGARGSAIRCH